MGGGNGQKSATARARKQEADAKRKGAGACKAQVQSLHSTMLLKTGLISLLQAAGSQLKQNAAAQSVVVRCLALSVADTQLRTPWSGLTRLCALQCQICRASFLCTASAAKLQEHVESKHSKNGYAVCALTCMSMLHAGYSAST